MSMPNSSNCPKSLPAQEPVMLSALQHYVFCARQYALIDLEQQWQDNAKTSQGSQAHERVHLEAVENRGNTTVLRALPLFSQTYGLFGVADVVEVHSGVPLPVEYKSGRHKLRLADEVQLCAQAMCLEEMFDCQVNVGYIYHIASRKRREVVFTSSLRQTVLEACDGIRHLRSVHILPPPIANKSCELCSLIDDCEPFAPRDFPTDFDPFYVRGDT